MVSGGGQQGRLVSARRGSGGVVPARGRRRGPDAGPAAWSRRGAGGVVQTRGRRRGPDAGPAAWSRHTAGRSLGSGAPEPRARVRPGLRRLPTVVCVRRGRQTRPIGRKSNRDVRREIHVRLIDGAGDLLRSEICTATCNIDCAGRPPVASASLNARFRHDSTQQQTDEIKRVSTRARVTDVARAATVAAARGPAARGDRVAARHGGRASLRGRGLAAPVAARPTSLSGGSGGPP
jgi:hypothetical protein